MNRILSLLIAFFFLHIGVANAQDPGLANQYFTDGEFEKAASVYEQLLEKDQNSDYYFSRYIASLTELKEFDRCEKAIKKQLKKQPENNTL
ncbi:MAG: hypothetical protein IT269_03605, partial [Saprospiraceae bacterium]|nr:hypothetical protein [Saprospiraceae bacterium]